MKRIGVRARRRMESTDAASWIRVDLDELEGLPALIVPATEGVDLTTWVEQQRDHFEALLLDHRALLFRGFGVDADGFARFVAASSDGDRLGYVDRTTPRETRGDRIYTSTVYPPDQRIELHNEGTYWRRWAKKLYFGCTVAATSGGQTPIADVRGVYRRLTPELRRPFADHGFMLVRNYNDGLGLRWQDVFQTDDPKAIEAHCRAEDILFEWKEGKRLRTRSIRPAIRRHPESGEPVWFNHAAFFHSSSLEPQLRATLLDQLGAEGLPFDTRYGDGTPIEDEVVAVLRAAYLAERRMFTWEPGDVMLLDNMSVAHAREPFGGPREVLVAMTEAVDDGATVWEEP